MSTTTTSARSGRVVRATLAIALSGALLAGCAGTGQPEPAEPTPTPTASSGAGPTVWERTVSGLGPDGLLTKDAALAAYTLAIGPLPGVDRPPGDPGPISSGTIAVDSVLAHWQELSPAQRETLSGALGVGLVPQAAGTPTPIARCAAQDSPDAGPYRAMVNDAIAKIAAKFGPIRGLQIVVVVDGDGEVGENLRTADAYASACVGTRSVEWDEQITSCSIHVRPSGDLQRLPPDEVQVRMIHETMHCFIQDRYGTAQFNFPAWYREGLPNWAAVALGPQSDGISTWWRRYLERGGGPLDQLSYDGLGFFVHHQELGLDTWAMARRVGAAFGDTGAGWQAAGLPEAFLNSWGSGLVQGRYPGTSWTSVGPNLPQHQVALDHADVPEGHSATIRSTAFAPAAAELHIDSEVVQVYPGAGAHGRISLGGDQDATLDVAQSKPYCTMDPWRCKCPKDSARADTKFGLMDEGVQYLGFTGGVSAASVSVTGMSLEDFCDVSTLAGKWRSVSVKSKADLELSDDGGGQWRWSVKGGAGIRLEIDKSGKIKLYYTGMQRLAYAMDTDAGITQSGTITCSGTDSIAVPPKSIKGKSGRWSPTPGKIGSTGTIDVTAPAVLHDSAGPGKGGCGAVFRGDLTKSGSWRWTPKSLTITTELKNDLGSQFNVWTFVRG